MAIKKGRATDAVARLFSVTAAEQAHEAYEAYEVQEPIFLKKDRLFLIGNFTNRRFSEILSNL